MLKPKVLATRVIPDSGLEIVTRECDAVIWSEEIPMPRSNLLESVRGIDGLLSQLSDNIDAQIMESAGLQLKVISNYAVGFDNIDLAEATRRGIFVANTPDVLTETTADLAFALLLAGARRLSEGIDYVRAGKWLTWGPKLLLGYDVYGATLGIVGLGRIGRAVARRSRGFDMRVIFYDPDAVISAEEAKWMRPAANLDQLLSESDFVTLHTPLTSDSDRLIGEAALAKMKSTAVLINTSRGRVVDTEALYCALQAGRIAYAALDVTDPEPLPSDHKLLGLPNCIVIPHIGSASVATRNRMAVMAAENLLAGVRGQRPKYLVNAAVNVERAGD